MNAKTFALRSKLIQFAILIATAFAVFPAKAWNNVGHRAVAELAWRKLDTNERRAVSELLTHHPHYKEFLTAKIPDGVSREEWAFLMAAVWPDWVRPAKKGQPFKPESITKYDLYPHAIGFPFLNPGDTNRALLENFFIAKPDAEMVLSNSLATLENPKANAHDRAVSLSWTLHLMGDLHQPLHAASLVTTERPRGDALGGHYNVIDPRGGDRARKTNLHSLWDQLAGVEPTYKCISGVADKLSGMAQLNPLKLPEYREHKTIHSWVMESFEDAVNFAYNPKRVQWAHSDDLESGKISADQIPTLRKDYISGAEQIANRRMILAAQRLTDELKKVW